MRKRLRRPTITDVAGLAEVATGTVSRVMNRHPDVSEGIKQRVRAAANELGYVRLRKSGESNGKKPRLHGNIGVICFGIGDSLVNIPIIHRTLQGIEASLSERGKNVMIADVPSGDRSPNFLLRTQVDGLILKGPNHGGLPSAQENELVRQIEQLPHIWIMGKPMGVEGDESNFDMAEAGRIAAKCFREHGHRRVAFLNGRPGHVQFEKLKDAFFAAARRWEIEVIAVEPAEPEKVVWPLPATSYQEDIERLAIQYWDMPGTTRPTAIFVPADHTAIQLYAAFSKLGIQVGKDVSLLSCNRERLMTANLHPQLASIEVHAEVFGRRAVDQLLWRMANPHDRHHFDVLVKPELVMGESMRQILCHPV